MTVYTQVRAQYSRGMLKLLDPLVLPEGAEVRLSVETMSKSPEAAGRSGFVFPNRPQPASILERLTGIFPLGGDALADSEAMYDGE